MSGGARSSLQWLRRQLEDTAADLSPGDIVLTGTPLGLYPVRGGDQVAILIDDKVGALCAIV
jgi:2-keto-4-pentenoate hydratase/2-oxohepta-3-ene-1,7-dioic acid hydratase in catechol pathway